MDRARVGLAALIGLLALALVVAELLDGESGKRTGSAAALTLTEYDLLSRAATIEPTAYWVGRRPGTSRFELERRRGDVYVRYLSDSSGTGPRSASLTVASYPLADAQASLETAARTGGGELARDGGRLTLHSPGSRSAYVVFAERPELQIEVYSPRPGQAAGLVAAGEVTPLHWTPLS